MKMKLITSFCTCLLILFIHFPSTSVGDFVKCDRKYTKVGCFVDTHNDMDLLVNDRQRTSPKHQKGHFLKWNKFPDSIHSLACRCYEEARKGGYTYIAIRFWAECYGGKSEASLRSLQENPKMKSTQCKSHEFKPCDDKHDHECVGMETSEYVFKLISDQAPPTTGARPTTGKRLTIGAQPTTGPQPKTGAKATTGKRLTTGAQPTTGKGSGAFVISIPAPQPIILQSPAASSAQPPNINPSAYHSAVAIETSSQVTQIHNSKGTVKVDHVIKPSMSVEPIIMSNSGQVVKPTAQIDNSKAQLTSQIQVTSHVKLTSQLVQASVAHITSAPSHHQTAGVSPRESQKVAASSSIKSGGSQALPSIAASPATAEPSSNGKTEAITSAVKTGPKISVGATLSSKVSEESKMTAGSGSMKVRASPTRPSLIEPSSISHHEKVEPVIDASTNVTTNATTTARPISSGTKILFVIPMTVFVMITGLMLSE